MNDKQIEVFVTAAKLLNFSEAAKVLYITQPAITYQIKSLEMELGVTLFERTSQGLLLTDAGKAFLEKAMDLNKRFKDSVSSVSKFKKQQEIVIGCASIMISVDAGFFTALLEALSTMHPDYSFSYSMCQENFDIGALKNGEADIVYANVQEPPQKSIFGSKWLFDSDNFVMVSSKSPLAKSDSISLSDIEKQKVYVSHSDPNYTHHLVKLIQAKSGKRLGIKDVPSFEMASMYVAKGDGVAFSPIPFETKTISFIPFDFEYRFPIYLVWLKKRQDKLLESIVSIISQAYDVRSQHDSQTAANWLNQLTG